MEGLSKLADSFLPFIVLIVIAGTRIFAMVRRQARNREQSQRREEGAFQDGAPQKDIRVFHPWEDEYREKAEADNDDDNEEFSAWSLSVNEGAPEKTAPVTPPKPAPPPARPVPAETENASVFTGLSSTSPVPVSGEIPAWLQSPAQPLEARPTETRALEAAAAASVENRIRSLPPLQQGVVWAEILGTPKGL
jgi:hypothetical protein